MKIQIPKRRTRKHERRSKKRKKEERAEQRKGKEKKNVNSALSCSIGRTAQSSTEPIEASRYICDIMAGNGEAKALEQPSTLTVIT